MSLLTTTLLTLGKLGKGLVPNAMTKLLDVMLSSDSGNVLKFGTDNGLLYVPAGLSLIKQAEFFTATTLTSQTNGGWKKDPNAKWIVAIATGGGGSGSCFNSYQQTSSGGGGEPGAVEIYSGPASDFPATADVVIGLGGSVPTTVTASVDGGDTNFGTLLLAKGGRGFWSYVKVARNPYLIGSYLARCSFRLGLPGVEYTAGQPAANPQPEDTPFGPGAGAAIGSYGGVGQTGAAFPTTGVAGGASSTNRPQSRVAGGAAISSPAAGAAGNNGNNAVAGDPLSFGSGGGSGGYGGTGGNGGIPGGGGAATNAASTNTTSYYCAPGAGGRGEVRVLTYG